MSYRNHDNFLLFYSYFYRIPLLPQVFAADIIRYLDSQQSACDSIVTVAPKAKNIKIVF